MPFLTKERTNWKYILIVAILAVIVGGWIFGYLRYFEREMISITKFPKIERRKTKTQSKTSITSFDECLTLRKKIGGWSGSNFCECNAPDGRIFVKQIENLEDLFTKYTDEEFGFSFYYPRSFKISSSHEFFEGDIFLTNVGAYNDVIIIIKKLGPRVEDFDAKFGKVAYFFDESKNQWMEEEYTEFGMSISPIKPSSYTISGLPIFPGKGRWETNIVALSTNKFLIINISGSGWTEILDPLTKTVIRTDQKVEDEKLKNALKDEICSLEWQL
jgi:hypothetical protein